MTVDQVLALTQLLADLYLTINQRDAELAKANARIAELEAPPNG